MGECAHRELREKIQPEILELIKQQRLNRLCEGSSFRKIGNRRRQGKGVAGAWVVCQGCLPGYPTLYGTPLPSTAHVSPAYHPCFPERFWHCRLALNHKVLHYGDLDDNPQGEVTFESLQEKSRCMSPLVCQQVSQVLVLALKPVSAHLLKILSLVHLGVVGELLNPSCGSVWVIKGRTRLHGKAVGGGSKATESKWKPWCSPRHLLRLDVVN